METIELELSRIFVKVVQHGGFSQAAEILRIQKSTVSKAVTKLEKMTGTKLLLRTTRSHTLTAAGRLFYETCLEPIQILEDAQKSLYGLDSIASGTIKLTAPEDFGPYLVAPIVGQICRQNPMLRFDLQYTNEVVDLVKDGFDLAIRIGKLRESQLKMRKIGDLELILVASESYLESAPKLSKPEELVEHSCLTISGLAMSNTWQLESGRKKARFQIKPVIESNQMSSLVQATIAGAGVLLAPKFICEPHIRSGQLKRILKPWNNRGLPISLVSPVSIASTARLKLVSDELVKTIKEAIGN
ncbi:LysR family transcriptional regulator [Bacteriovorax sp. DB6_IX]|uniref:LysR family transcriptional regulator n=1 Tax=Bacteriovorax sp. DB6_IX TaxID=1353530 RepID=UPI00038A46C9|nr:LysR family transcriptional regulator [Bacteriovorax sp. DB6_IX]EQC51305.1 LysR substrate-binding domain protein [Bacteriovorax sp. DB6_IX]